MTSKYNVIQSNISLFKYNSHGSSGNYVLRIMDIPEASMVLKLPNRQNRENADSVWN